MARLLASRDAQVAALSSQPAEVNGYPALVLRFDGEIDTIVALRIDDGLVSAIYAVRNPEVVAHAARDQPASVTGSERATTGRGRLRRVPAGPSGVRAGDAEQHHGGCGPGGERYEVDGHRHQQTECQQAG
ncbi:hypothetical protein NKG94_49790 [Micromonospora sp. M12]